MKKFLAFKSINLAKKNVKMSTIVGILTFMSRVNFVLSWVEHEKSFITSGPGLEIIELFISAKHEIYPAHKC